MAAAIEHRRAVRQRAVGFHVAVHPLGREQLRVHRGDDRHRVVQVDALHAQVAGDRRETRRAESAAAARRVRESPSGNLLQQVEAEQDRGS